VVHLLPHQDHPQDYPLILHHVQILSHIHYHMEGVLYLDIRFILAPRVTRRRRIKNCLLTDKDLTINALYDACKNNTHILCMHKYYAKHNVLCITDISI
jgi:hypothetical protein